MARQSPLYYINPSDISLVPNANSPVNNDYKDIAVYVAKDTKIKVYCPSFGIDAINGQFQEWTLEGKNRRLKMRLPYTIYAHLNQEDKSDGYIRFTQKVYSDGELTDAYHDVSEFRGYWYIKIGEVSAPDAETGERTLTLDTGVLGTDQFNTEWALNPDALPLRIDLSSVITGADGETTRNGGPTPYVYWGEALTLSAAITEGWTGTDIKRFDHWEITRDSGNAEADAEWNASANAGDFKTTGIIALQHGRGQDSTDDFNGAVSATFTVNAIENHNLAKPTGAVGSAQLEAEKNYTIGGTHSEDEDWAKFNSEVVTPVQGEDIYSFTPDGNGTLELAGCDDTTYVTETPTNLVSLIDATGTARLSANATHIIGGAHSTESGWATFNGTPVAPTPAGDGTYTFVPATDGELVLLGCDNTTYVTKTPTNIITLSYTTCAATLSAGVTYIISGTHSSTGEWWAKFNGEDVYPQQIGNRKYLFTPSENGTLVLLGCDATTNVRDSEAPLYSVLKSASIDIMAETWEKYEVAPTTAVMAFNPMTGDYTPSDGIRLRVRSITQKSDASQISFAQYITAELLCQYAQEGSSTWIDITTAGIGQRTWQATIPKSAFESGKSVNVRLLRGDTELHRTTIAFVRDGEDSKEREWIFLRSTEAITFGPPEPPYPAWINIGEVNPAGEADGNDSNKNQDGWVPNGWWDEQQGVDATNRYEYGAYRDFVHESDGVTAHWGAFTEPRIWNHWGEDGDDGLYYVDDYRRYDSRSANATTGAPAGNSDMPGWTETAPAQTETYKYIWKRSRQYNPNTQQFVGNPIYVCLTGERGVDAQDIEWAFIRTKTDTAPVILSDSTYVDSNSHDYTADDHLPHVGGNSNIENNEGTYECTDDPKGVDDTWKFEWEIKREKADADSDGKRAWNYYQGSMTLHANYAESAYIIDLSNDNDQFGTDSNSFVQAQQTRSTTVSVYDGATKQTLSNLTVELEYEDGTPVSGHDVANYSANAATGVVSVILERNTAAAFSHTEVRALITASVTSKADKQAVFTVRKVMSGQPGLSPTVYQLNPTSKGFVFNRGADGQTLTPAARSTTVNALKTYENVTNDATLADNLTFTWGFDESATAQGSGTVGDSGSNVISVSSTLAAAHYQVWILLSTGDRETLPILKDGQKGDNGEDAQYIYLKGTARDVDGSVITTVQNETNISGGNNMAQHNRGLNLVTVNRQTMAVVESLSYDTYLEGRGDAGATGITDLVAKLNTLDDTVFVCLTSFDAIGWNDTLISALQSCGMDDLPYTALGRYPFLFIGYKNLGKGNGLTRMRGIGHYYDVVELSAYVANGALTMRDGKSVTKVSETAVYQVSDSGTTTPTGTWHSTKQAAVDAYNTAHSISGHDWQPNTFMWTRTTIAWSDNTTTMLYDAERNPDDGKDAVNVVVAPASMIVQQDINNKDNIAHAADNNLGMFSMQVLKGSTACNITSITASANQVYMSDSASAGDYTGNNCRTWTPNSQIANMYLKGIGKDNQNNYYTTGQITLSITYTDPDTNASKTVTGIIAKVYVNLVGTWSETIEGDVETSVAEKLTYGYDHETGQTGSLQAIGKYIRSSENNISTIQGDMYDQQGDLVLSSKSELSQTASEIVSSVHSDLAGGNENLLYGVDEYDSVSNALVHTSSLIDGVKEYDGKNGHLHIFTSVQLVKGCTYTIQCVTDGTIANQHDGLSAHSPSLKLCTLWLRMISTLNGATYNGECFTTSHSGYEDLGSGRHKWTFTCRKTGEYWFRTNSYSDGATAVTINFWNIKLEGGDTATTWSTNASQMTSQIKQTANEIEAKVNDTGVNITNGTIKLIAGKVHFYESDGETVNPNVWIDTAQSTLHTKNAVLDGSLFRPFTIINKDNIDYYADYWSSDGAFSIDMNKAGLNLQINYAYVDDHPGETLSKEIELPYQFLTDYNGAEVQIFNARSATLRVLYCRYKDGTIIKLEVSTIPAYTIRTFKMVNISHLLPSGKVYGGMPFHTFTHNGITYNAYTWYDSDYCWIVIDDVTVVPPVN